MPKSATAKERSKKRSAYVFTALGLIAGIAAATLTNSGDSEDRSAAPAGLHQTTATAVTVAQESPAYPPTPQVATPYIPGWQGPSATGTATQSI